MIRDVLQELEAVEAALPSSAAADAASSSAASRQTIMHHARFIDPYLLYRRA